MADRLKPCPFCGGDNVGVFEHKFHCKEPLYTANCFDCHFGIHMVDTEEEAIEAWNTRKPMDRILEKLIEENEYSNKHHKEEFSFRAGLGVAINIVKAGGKGE